MAHYIDMAEAYTIFAKYSEPRDQNSHAEHDELMAGPSPDIVSDEDKERLSELGWMVHEEDCFYKFT